MYIYIRTNPSVVGISAHPCPARHSNRSQHEFDNHNMDTLAEWLRRRPAKPMGSPRVGSNPTGVDLACSAAGFVALFGRSD